MASTPVRLAEDRSLVVPRGHIVKTGYVDVFDVRHACRDRMAVGDVETAYRKRLQLGSSQPWPVAVGEWGNDGRYVLHDGRHEWVAAVMLGFSHILVGWVTRPDG